uniref:Uncharacterized protein n=1 Tax=Panagrolaimus sp. JU765 TaxID=591449 RepID=A0AC34QS37_9BILA
MISFLPLCMRHWPIEIEELKEYVSCLISNLEAEKLKREQLFEEFKESTLEEIQKLYQEQLKELTDELTSLDAVLNENVNENEKLNKELFETKKQLSMFEKNKQMSEIHLIQKFEKQVENLNQKLKDSEK